MSRLVTCSVGANHSGQATKPHAAVQDDRSGSRSHRAGGLGFLNDLNGARRLNVWNDLNRGGACAVRLSGTIGTEWRAVGAARLLSRRDQRRLGKVTKVLRETLGLPAEKTQEHASRFDKRLWYRVSLFWVRAAWHEVIYNSEPLPVRRRGRGERSLTKKELTKSVES